MMISKLRVTCQGCTEVFDAEIVTNAPLDVAVASMKAIRCPKCGGFNCGLGGSYKDHPPLTAALEERAAWWIERGETGTSSLTIYCAMAGRSTSPHRDFCYPLDPDDFRRCKQLLDLIPEWRAELGKVSERFPWFAPFIYKWLRFERLYEQESPSGRCEKLYNEMQIARKEADALRWPQSANAAKSQTENEHPEERQTKK